MQKTGKRNVHVLESVIRDVVVSRMYVRDKMNKSEKEKVLPETIWKRRRLTPVGNDGKESTVETNSHEHYFLSSEKKRVDII